MLFLETGALNLGNEILIKDGMNCLKMELLCRRFSNIQRIGADRYDYYYRIMPFVYLGYKLAFRVYYAFDMFLYIAFSTLNGTDEKGIVQKKPHQKLKLFHQNNSFIEFISRKVLYEKRVSNLRVDYIFNWGRIISQYEKVLKEAVCLVRFDKH